jgi:hypothetical protein
MEENRIRLFQAMKSDGYSKTYQVWLDNYFSDANGVDTLWNILIDNDDYTKPKSEFYKRYVCGDLEWAKNNQYCKTEETGRSGTSGSGGSGTSGSGGSGTSGTSGSRSQDDIDRGKAFDLEKADDVNTMILTYPCVFNYLPVYKQDPSKMIVMIDANNRFIKHGNDPITRSLLFKAIGVANDEGDNVYYDDNGFYGSVAGPKDLGNSVYGTTTFTQKGKYACKTIKVDGKNIGIIVRDGVDGKVPPKAEDVIPNNQSGTQQGTTQQGTTQQGTTQQGTTQQGTTQQGTTQQQTQTTQLDILRKMVSDGLLRNGTLVNVKFKEYTHGYKGKKGGVDIVLLHDGGYLKNDGSGWRYIPKADAELETVTIDTETNNTETNNTEGQ